jgi:hypothetical protein
MCQLTLKGLAGSQTQLPPNWFSYVIVDPSSSVMSEPEVPVVAVGVAAAPAPPFVRVARGGPEFEPLPELSFAACPPADVELEW